MQTIETAIEIKATPDRIWHLLTRSRERPWDPLFSAVHGTLAPGEKLLLRLRGGRSVHARVTAFEQGRVLEWNGGIFGLLDSRHRFELVRTGERTLFKHTDCFRGLLPSLFGRQIARVAVEYGGFNRALKAEAERINAPAL